MKKLLFILLILGIPVVAVSDDTDIYGISPIEVKPNVLIIFDNSGSMSTKDVPGATYEDNVAYDGAYTKDVVYRYSNSYFPDINDPNWQCQAAKDKLQEVGYWKGRLSKPGGIVKCSASASLKTYKLGNYRNFKAANLGNKRIRMVVAKEVIAKLIAENTDTVKFGVMKFYTEEGGYIASPCAQDNRDALIGDYDLASPPTFTNSDQSGDYGAIGGMRGQTWTPLAETTAEAGLYFAGAKPRWFSTGNYTSPIENRCQKNYIILITDGAPTRDNNWKLSNKIYLNGKKIPDDGHDGASNYLDDVTYFLKNNDLRSDLGKDGDFKDQTVKTYTIGFKQSLQLLEDAALNGGGRYYTADNATALNEALNSIITSIKEDNENFSAAAVPVSRANKAYAGNHVYYSLFQPLNTGAWIGNIKKYTLANGGELQDVTGTAIIKDGKMSEDAQSFWSPFVDGIKVNKGGVGEKLEVDIENGKVRNIYTYTGTNTTLTDETNKFAKTNSFLNDTNYDRLTESVIDTVRREDGSFPLGDFLHTQPLVAHYDTTIPADGIDDFSVVLAGSNDGMLHAFNDADGSELWAYIPSDLLGNLYQLEDDVTHSYFVDGASLLYSYDHDTNSATALQQLFIFGERRGGYNYSVLNLTDYTTPKLQYEIGLNILGTGNETLGQSWGKPQVVTMGYLDGSSNYLTKKVFFLPGGYDENQDSLPTDTPPLAATDNAGRAVFAVDIETGAVLDNATITNASFSKMTHSIVAASAFENPKTRTTTRIYAGDMNGNVFAFRDDVYHYNRFEKYADKHDDMFDGIENGDWSQKLLLHASPGKKIFYSPNIVNEYFIVGIDYPKGILLAHPDGITDKPEKRVGDYVFYGTGDRAHPKRTDIENAIYAIKNSWQWETADNANLVEAYVDVNDVGKIKAIDDNRILVGQQRNAQGLLVDGDGKAITVEGNGEKFIIDVTRDLIQNQNADLVKRVLMSNYVKDAIFHSANRGWFIRFVEEAPAYDKIGEKIVSTPIIYNGVIYFTTYVPEADAVTPDPCASPSAQGTGYLWAINYKTGEAVDGSFYTPNDEPGKPIMDRPDRRRALPTGGIPPQPVVVVQEDGVTVITGFDQQKPTVTPNMLRRYWRHL